MSKILLAVAIAHAFINNPNEDSLLVTPDGNCFRLSSKGNAELHARQNNVKVSTVNREDYAKEIAAEQETFSKRKETVEAAEKAANDKVNAGIELKERALAIGLDETATLEEVEAAEAADKKAKAKKK